MGSCVRVCVWVGGAGLKVCHSGGGAGDSEGGFGSDSLGGSPLTEGAEY